MSRVVYRGVEYDTEKRIEYQQQMQQQSQQYNETYRGVKFVKEGHKWKNSTSYKSLKNRSKKKRGVVKHLLLLW